MSPAITVLARMDRAVRRRDWETTAWYLLLAGLRTLRAGATDPLLALLAAPPARDEEDRR